MTSVDFHVTAKVRGCARPRVTRNGTYIPKTTREYQKAVKDAFKSTGAGKMTGPIAVSIDVFRKLPSGEPKSVTHKPDTVRPDADNIAKTILDALNGLAWEDDNQVVFLCVQKHPRSRAQKEDCVVVNIRRA